MRIMRPTSPRPSTVVFWRASRPRGRARRSEKVEAANVDFQIGDSFRFACLLFLNRDPQDDLAVAVAGPAHSPQTVENSVAPVAL
jgi:hypothetical protein